MREIDFKVIFAAENSNKFQKTRFWKEKSVEDVVTLGPTSQATLVQTINNRFVNVLYSLIWTLWKTRPNTLDQVFKAPPKFRHEKKFVF